MVPCHQPTASRRPDHGCDQPTADTLRLGAPGNNILLISISFSCMINTAVARGKLTANDTRHALANRIFRQRSYYPMPAIASYAWMHYR